MINFNGTLIQSETIGDLNKNRSFLYGDGVFETLKIANNKILFFEDHYFRLMASMRILRMEIPMEFTMEFIENEIIKLVSELNLLDSARVRMTVYRNTGGFYQPIDNSVSYCIEAFELTKAYTIGLNEFAADLYKDNYIPKSIVSTLKTTSKIINVISGVYAQENDLNTCVLINSDKNVVEAISGNLFFLYDNIVKTPPISDGCLNGIMRKKIIEILKDMPAITILEESISPFDIQNADEVWITNVIKGIQPITTYRRKKYKTEFSNELVSKLNLKYELV